MSQNENKIEIEIKDGIRYLKDTNAPIDEMFYASMSGAAGRFIANHFGITEEQVNDCYVFKLNEMIKEGQFNNKK